MASTPPKALREGASPKRAAIVAAGRELFLAEGFERTSMDAVALRAGVSKRTVYDYFGDKETLLTTVFDEAARSVMDTIETAISAHLSGPTDVEAALTAFARAVAASAMESTEYVSLVRLAGAESSHIPSLHNHWIASAPEEAVADQLAQYGADGLLNVPEPRLAADHFMALTFSLLFNSVQGAGSPQGITRIDAAQDRTIVEGVRAFVRAYAPRR